MNAVGQLSLRVLYTQVNTLNSERVSSFQLTEKVYLTTLLSEKVGEMTEHFSTIISHVVYFEGEAS